MGGRPTGRDCTWKTNYLHAQGTTISIWCLNAIKSTKNTSQVHEREWQARSTRYRLWHSNGTLAKYLCLMGKFQATAPHATSLAQLTCNPFDCQWADISSIRSSLSLQTEYVCFMNAADDDDDTDNKFPFTLHIRCVSFYRPNYSIQFGQILWGIFWMCLHDVRVVDAAAASEFSHITRPPPLLLQPCQASTISRLAFRPRSEARFSCVFYYIS